MGRLNFRDSDYHIKNGAHQSRVRERSYLFERDYTQPPPKILISSVSEDRSVMSPPFRPAAARSWSIEDFLADSPHMEDISSRVVKDPKESVSEVSANSTSVSPRLSHTYSPTGSSVLESVTGDSAINSPDSWVESEFGMIPEKFCESRSESSLCDSGTAWDVYRATPVEVTTLDEGFVPSMEDKSPDEHSISESYIDEAICSLSSLESTQEQIQGHPEKTLVEVVKEKGENYENCNQYNTLEQVPDQSETEITKEVDSKPMDMSTLQKDDISGKQEPSSGLCETVCAEVLANSGFEDHLETDKTNQFQLSSESELPPPGHPEERIKQTSLENSTDRELECLKETVDFTGDGRGQEGQNNGQVGLNERNKSVENECQKPDPPLEDKKENPTHKSEILKERDEGVVEPPEKASEGVLSDCTDYQKSITIDSSDALANMPLTNQNGASQAILEQSMGMNIPLISIFSEPEELKEEETCDSERQAHAGDEQVHQPEITGNNGTDTDVSSPQKPDKLTCDSYGNDDNNLVEIPSCLMSENVKTTSSEQNRDVDDGQLEDIDEHEISNCSNVDIYVPYTTDDMEISEAKEQYEFPPDNALTHNTDKDFTVQTSVETKAEQKIPDDTSQNDTANKQQSSSNPVNSESNGKIGTLRYEPASVSRNIDLFYADFDLSFPTEDLVGDPVEPMDLFYPDKEEPMFTELLDTEMQSWPSVLSVSALEPAPASEALADDQPLNLTEDLRDGVDLIQENKVKVSLFSNGTVQQFPFQISFTVSDMPRFHNPWCTYEIHKKC